MTTVVPVSQYRREMKEYHRRAAAGEIVVVTEHGTPIVRVTSAPGESEVERLRRNGLLTRPHEPRPAANLPDIPAPGDSTTSISAARER